MAGKTIQVLASAGELAAAAAEFFVQTAAEAIAERGRCMVALAGGRTPADLYDRLAAAYQGASIWQQMHFFWSDERHVPPEHPESNFRMAYQHLLCRLAIDAHRIHAIRGELSTAEEAADDYEVSLRRAFDLQREQRPRFDLMLLGMGADGHTASLFPRSLALEERRRLVVATSAASVLNDRISLSLPVLTHAETVLFYVTGAAKAIALRAVLEARDDIEQLPAGMVHRGAGRVVWFVDLDAAQDLSTESARPRQD